MINATKPCQSDMADYERYDKVWQRVAPGVQPYQGTERTSAGSAVPAFAEQEKPTVPGDNADPCCMGTEAMEMTEVIEGYITDELSDCAFYRAFARCARTKEGRAMMLEFARDEHGHAQRLMAAYYLITGKCFTPVVMSPATLPNWCDGLRMRYHAEACGGLNYARSADDTLDTCLAQMFREMSSDEYSHADRILNLLSKMFC